jgi:hypothetical protein
VEVQVDVVHRNLLTSDWYDPDHHESLLNTQRYACRLDFTESLSCTQSHADGQSAHLRVHCNAWQPYHLSSTPKVIPLKECSRIPLSGIFIRRDIRLSGIFSLLFEPYIYTNHFG